MSNKKNLLNEAQVRQFMKLASLQPLTPGFVNGLTERGAKAGDEGSVAAGKKGDTDYSGEGERKGDESETHAGKDLEEGTEEEIDEVHGRGANEYHKAGQHRGGGVKLDEEGLAYRDDPEAELGATEDELGAEDELAGEEGEEVADLEADVDAEGEVDAAAEGTLTVAQVVDAIESALQDLLPGEEVEAEYVDDEEGVEDVDAEAEFAPEGDEVVADVEVGEEELEEGAREDRWAAMTADPRPKGAREKRVAAEFAATAGTVDPDAPESDARQRMRSRRGTFQGTSGKPAHRGTFQEGVSTDELVEQVTKRVAARILKSALRKK
jgi:hypothetical protein